MTAPLCEKHQCSKKRRSDGKGWRCPECLKESDRRYYEANRERLLAQSAARYEQNKDQVKQRTKEWHLQHKYGITLEEFDALLKRQGGRCAICRKKCPKSPKRRWHVDHNNKSGKVRGVLCHNCNVTLGHVREKKKVLKAAIAYLESHRE